MRKFERELITEWRRLEMPVSGSTVVLGVSGGADSVSLLLALSELVKLEKLDIRLVAAHFNHNLRGDESSKDEEFVKSLTTSRNVELVLGRATEFTDGNVEQEARNARYTFLKSTAANVGASAVLTAHTQNDQAETFLINLIRGSGAGGLSGMKAVRRLSKSNQTTFLIRPLLSWAKRRDTENYCHEMGVEFRFDSMNEDLSFVRVRVRKLLIPMLEEFNPRMIETLCDTADLLAIDNEAIEATLPGDLVKMDAPDLKTLKELGKARFYRSIRKWLGRQKGDLRRLDLKHIQAIENLVYSAKSGKVVELPGGTVVKHDGKLTFEHLKVEK